MASHVEEFGVFFRDCEHGLASVIVDLSIGNSAPLSHLPNLLRVTVLPAGKSLENGYENNADVEIESDLVSHLAQTTGAAFVARELTQRHLKFFFYVPLGTSAAPLVVQALQKHAGVRHRSSCIFDPDWSIYFDELYPGRVEFQLMANHGRPISAGVHTELLGTPRPICHWVYFADCQHREQFLERIRTRDFRIHLLERREPDNWDKPYCVELARDDRADHPYLDELVHWLSRQAEEFDGEYDGFEAESILEHSLDLSATLE